MAIAQISLVCLHGDLKTEKLQCSFLLITDTLPLSLAIIIRQLDQSNHNPETKKSLSKNEKQKLFFYTLPLVYRPVLQAN